MKDGFVKVAAATPVIKVADVGVNTKSIIDCMEKAAENGAKVLVFPDGINDYEKVSGTIVSFAIIQGDDVGEIVV